MKLPVSETKGLAIFEESSPNSRSNSPSFYSPVLKHFVTLGNNINRTALL